MSVSLQQLSNLVYCDAFILSLKLESRLMANPYHDYPFLIIRNFLDAGICHEIVNEMQAKEAMEAEIKTFESGALVSETNSEIRSTKIHSLSSIHLQHYQKRFLEIQKEIEAFFAIALTVSTDVQTLEYTAGDFYISHADDSSEIRNDDDETIGYVCVVPERKITSVLFASSDYEGGALSFRYLYDKNGDPVIFKPAPGDMIVFPSNPIFAHEVLPVLSGYRLTLVQWHNAIIE